MYRQIVLGILFNCFVFAANAQFTIHGKITSVKDEPLEGASISIKNSYSGATSGKDGSFSFELSDTGRQVLVVSMMGYRPFETALIVAASLELDIQLKEAISEMKAVVITAGSFEASDKKRTTVLKSIDMVTTAGQQADVVAALKTLTGAQQIGEQEGLFVRGGTGAETKVFIDGMMVNNPFFSSVPGIAQRSRYSPLLFKGTIFSTGGYSALYGQALSSALVLESIDLPSRSEVNLIVSSAQLSFMGQQLNKQKTGSTGININYNNLAPYFSAVPQKYNYTKAPEVINTEFNLRQKTKTGIFKLYAYANYNELGVKRPNLDEINTDEHFQLQNQHVFTNATYSARLKSGWHLFSGASFSYNKDRINMTGFEPVLTNRLAQSKLVFTKNFAGLTKLYMGMEYQHIRDGIVAKDSIDQRYIHENYLAAFIESEIYYSAKLVSRMGMRFEHSSLLHKAVVSPRVSFAYKLNEKTQFSFAYGMFYQKPETNFLLRKPLLDLTKAMHYILNFQRVYNGQTLRVESFYKKYEKLITTNSNNPFDINNEGFGYAKGIELFWRDKTSIKDLDYWISYSYLDTKRKFLDYYSLVQPSFAAKHTVSVVAKRFVNAIATQFSATYSYASGRPYFNPNKSAKDFMADRTIDYHSLGLQANYLRTFGKVNAVFIVNISNALGFKQVFGYRYSSHINSNGNYASEAITPMAKRFVFIGAYLSIGADRRKEILD